MKDLPLQNNEYIIQSSSAVIDIGTTDVLRLSGNLYLTNRRLIFERQGRVLFATFLQDIVDVSTEMRKWILPHAKKLLISYRAKPGDSTRTASVALKSPLRWQKLIKDRMVFALFDE